MGILAAGLVQAQEPVALAGSSPVASSVFNVKDFGAKGDGHT